MYKKLVSRIATAVVLTVATGQALCILGILFGFIPTDGLAEMAMFWSGALAWSLFILAEWKRFHKERHVEVGLLIATTLLAFPAIATAITRVSYVREIAHVVNMLLWTAVICAICIACVRNR